MKVTVKATGETEERSAGGFSYIYIRSATANFQISFDGNEWSDAHQNDNWGPITGHRIYFRALNGAASTITADVGRKPFVTQDTSVKSQPADTYAKSGLDGAIAGNATQTFNGVNGTDKRKSIAVQNLDAGGNTVTVQDGSGNALAVLQAGWPPWVREVGGTIKVKNTNGAGLSRVIVDEVFVVT